MLVALSVGRKSRMLRGQNPLSLGPRKTPSFRGARVNLFVGILDDAREFVKREIRREVRYDGIVMDPPVFWATAQRKNYGR